MKWIAIFIRDATKLILFIASVLLVYDLYLMFSLQYDGIKHANIFIGLLAVFAIMNLLAAFIGDPALFIMFVVTTIVIGVFVIKKDVSMGVDINDIDSALTIYDKVWGIFILCSLLYLPIHGWIEMENKYYPLMIPADGKPYNDAKLERMRRKKEIAEWKERKN